jgi:transcriptional regulator with XRE-family HTH domain
MNHVEFGALVSSLREDIRWTQAELADRSGLGLALIHQVESGQRQGLLGDDLMVRLANALMLTTLERREFLIAASGLAELELLRPPIDGGPPRLDISAYLRELGGHISHMPLPVYVTDSFCDVVLANYCALEYFKPPAELLSDTARVVGGFNEIHYVFHRDSSFRQLIGEQDWDRQALLNVRHFRRRTLRFRSKSYFSALMKQFLDTHSYPYFERYWRKVAFEIHDEPSIPMVRTDPKWDRAFVQTESLLALTPYGELYLHQQLPHNQATAKSVEAMFEKAGEGYAQFAPLPDTRKM